VKVCFKQTPIGLIGISEVSWHITNLYFENEFPTVHSETLETDLINEAFNQLFAYFSCKLKVFSLPLLPHGSEFMKSVWDSISNIPYGKIATYKEIAIKIGNPNASRAVGLAGKKTPIPIFIPCHRVIGSNGTLTGYRGGLNVKSKLLALESEEPKSECRFS